MRVTYSSPGSSNPPPSSYKTFTRQHVSHNCHLLATIGCLSAPYCHLLPSPSAATFDHCLSPSPSFAVAAILASTSTHFALPPISSLSPHSLSLPGWLILAAPFPPTSNGLTALAYGITDCWTERGQPQPARAPGLNQLAAGSNHRGSTGLHRLASPT